MSLTLDPRNVGFVWSDRPKTGLRRLSAAEIDCFNAEGFIVLEDAVPAETCASLIAEIDPIEAAIEDYTIMLEDDVAFTYEREAMTFANDIALAAPGVADFCAGPLFQEVTHDLLGPDVRLYWNQAVYKKPEKGREFPWHQDNGYTYCEPQTYLTCWIALT
ncbi:MAG: phytanoyl-CoA dioxygenase family protein, partial [Sphingomonadales bacterium]|nr:phytanoyl-CoA dioxygenase family protein [Sphingomonadales bacterium]